MTQHLGSRDNKRRCMCKTARRFSEPITYYTTPQPKELGELQVISRISLITGEGPPFGDFGGDKQEVGTVRPSSSEQWQWPLASPLSPPLLTDRGAATGHLESLALLKAHPRSQEGWRLKEAEEELPLRLQEPWHGREEAQAILDRARDLCPSNQKAYDHRTWVFMRLYSVTRARVNA